MHAALCAQLTLAPLRKYLNRGCLLPPYHGAYILGERHGALKTVLTTVLPKLCEVAPRCFSRRHVTETESEGEPSRARQFQFLNAASSR